jgi:peptidoglycan/LPS O-acetylase OafA/YrhL
MIARSERETVLESNLPRMSVSTLEKPIAMPTEKVGEAEPRFYRPELDLLRFLAFFAVFVCHSLPAGPTSNSSGYSAQFWRFLLAIKDAGNFGVCMFFLLSSFLITELLRREYAKTSTVHVRSFFVRRMLRIWPLYFAVLLLFVAVGAFVPSFWIEPGRLLAYSLLVGNWYIVFHPLITGPLRSLWSISVEEQFYAIWPTIAKWTGIRGVAVLSIVLIPVSSISVLFFASRGQYLDVTLWLNSFVQFQFFGLGALLAIYFAGRVPGRGAAKRVGLAIAGAMLWLLASGICLIKRAGADPSPQTAALGYALAAFGGVLLFLSILGISERFVPRSLIYLGKISYGLYVFHELGFMGAEWFRLNVERPIISGSGPLLFVFNRGLALIITIALASISYTYLERPILRFKKRFTFVDSRAA